MSEQLLFYDIEVFKFDSLVVFKNEKKETLRIFHNDFKEVAEFIRGKTLVGFNCYYYDDKILTLMIEGAPQEAIKQANDDLISGKQIWTTKGRFKSLDVFQQIDVSNPSLKKIEGNMGRSIEESKIPFTIDTPLNEEQLEQTIFYCSYDVDTTIDIYKLRLESYFKPKEYLVEMLGKPHAQRWATTSISGALLLDKPLPRWDSVRIPPEMWLMVPEEVRELWIPFSSVVNKILHKGQKLKKTCTIEAFGCDIQFGFGGLHGAHKKIKKAKKVLLLDVKSMYPTIILILNCLGHASEKYREILIRRLAAKGVNDVLADALKLILNSVYGNLNNKYSILYNEMACLSVCLYGQIALFELCRRLAPFAEIININTDGVAFVPHSDLYERVVEGWQQEFHMELDKAKEFDLFLQKDVNNYIAVAGSKIICKGGDVNRYHKDALFKNNNARILDIALVDKLVYEKPIEITLTENIGNAKLFQYILKAGNTYQGTFTEKGEEFQKVNRIFAAKEENEGFCLYKRRHDEGLVKFADAPNNMIIWNEDCEKIEDLEEKLNLNHYKDIITKRLERWI
jgi:hypothetical protein